MLALSHISDHPEHSDGDVIQKEPLDSQPHFLPPPHPSLLVSPTPTRGPETDAKASHPADLREREASPQPPPPPPPHPPPPAPPAHPTLSVYSVAVCGTDSFSMDSLRTTPPGERV